METTNTHNKTYNDISLLENPPEALMALFKILKAPTLEETNGEFNAQMLTQNSTLLDFAWRAIIYTPTWPLKRR